MEKKLTNSGPLREPADKHSIYTMHRNARDAERPMEDLPHGQHIALHRTLNPSRSCGSVQAGHHCWPPRGLYHSRTTQRWKPTLWAYMGGATAASLPRSAWCDAHRAVLFSPPRDALSRLDDLCNLL